MSQDTDALANNLKTLSDQLENLGKKIDDAPSLNGGFEKLVLMVETLQTNQTSMHSDVSDIKKTVLDPDGGVIARVKVLEGWRERADPIIDQNEHQNRDLLLLMEWRRSMTKVLWAMATTSLALVVQAIFKLMTES